MERDFPVAIHHRVRRLIQSETIRQLSAGHFLHCKMFFKKAPFQRYSMIHIVSTPVPSNVCEPSECVVTASLVCSLCNVQLPGVVSHDHRLNESLTRSRGVASAHKNSCCMVTTQGSSFDYLCAVARYLVDFLPGTERNHLLASCGSTRKTSALVKTPFLPASKILLGTPDTDPPVHWNSLTSALQPSNNFGCICFSTPQPGAV